MQIQTVNGREYLYVTTTTTNEVYRLDLGNQQISVFANRTTINLATGAAVGSALASPDNLAIDHEGNIYIIEDRSGGNDNDIWFAKDLNNDGDLDGSGRRHRAVGIERHGGIRVHGTLLRPDRQAPRLGEHSAPRQRQRPDDRNHDSEIALGHRRPEAQKISESSGLLVFWLFFLRLALHNNFTAAVIRSPTRS